MLRRVMVDRDAQVETSKEKMKPLKLDRNAVMVMVFKHFEQSVNLAFKKKNSINVNRREKQHHLNILYL